MRVTYWTDTYVCVCVRVLRNSGIQLVLHVHDLAEGTCMGLPSCSPLPIESFMKIALSLSDSFTL